MSEKIAAGKLETEIKVRISDRAAFAARLHDLGFHLSTPETMERNVLFDTPDGALRKRREILRIRQYGDRWVVTHKAPVMGESGAAHKTRVELETAVEDGRVLARVFEQLGYRQAFVYEKRRSEWTDGHGQVVVDVTPIGDYAELEGEHGWIDATARRLGILPEEYLTKSYVQIFLDWKRANQHPAGTMTFAEIHGNAAS